MKLKMTPNTVSNYLFASLCRTVVGEGGRGRGIGENWLVHILDDDLKIRKVLNYFKNVIFTSKNFILTISPILFIVFP